jgi:DNA repair protein RecO (recombination protein O)
MLYTTRAIILHYQKYNDKSLVVKAYTQADGLKTLFVRMNSKIGLSYFQPLTLLNIVSYKKENNNMQNLKEVSLAEPWHSISGNIIKGSLAVFMAEVFIKSVKHEEKDDDLFSFLETTTRNLEHAKDIPALFPHAYLIGLSRFLGFLPTEPPEGATLYFDLMVGEFTSTIPNHPHYTDSTETALLAQCINWYLSEGAAHFHPDKARRELLLLRLLEYYRIHIESMGTIKSHLILKEVLA